MLFSDVFMKIIITIIDVIRIYFMVIKMLKRGGAQYVLSKVNVPIKSIANVEWFKIKHEVTPSTYVKIDFFICRLLNKIYFFNLSDKFKSTCFIRAITIFCLSNMYGYKAVLNIALPKNISILDLQKKRKLGHCWTTIQNVDYDSCLESWFVIKKIYNNIMR